MKPVRRTLLAVAAVLSTQAVAEDNYLGRSIASACYGCHGAGGMTDAAIPPIILGAPEEWIANALRAFRDGRRPATIMDRIAKGYNDEEIAAVAKYFASQRGQ